MLQRCSHCLRTTTAADAGATHSHARAADAGATHSHARATHSGASEPDAGSHGHTRSHGIADPAADAITDARADRHPAADGHP
jgi:hypothetical protein